MLDAMGQPETMGGRLSWSVPGRLFALGADGSQYLLLEDGSIGVWSSDGTAGRLAETFGDFLTFLVNCVDWQAFAIRPAGAADDWFQDPDLLHSVTEERKKLVWDGMNADFAAVQTWVSRELELPLCPELEPLLFRFYTVTLRRPQFTAFYREDDGSLTCAPGLISELYSGFPLSRDRAPFDREGPTEAEKADLAEKYGLLP